MKKANGSAKKIQRLEALLEEKNNLLREVYHRVKNNFQVIISLINLQIDSIKDPLTKKALVESNARIKTMVLVHEMLYESANLAEVEMQPYINDLLRYSTESYNINEDEVKLVVDVDTISLPVDSAVLCGLIINELVSNAIKYAFPIGKTGQIKVFIKDEKHTIHMGVQDNGIGFPDTFDVMSQKTLGMRLIVSLAKQLGGDVSIENQNGACFMVSFVHNVR